MYKGKTFVVVAAMTLFAASVSFAHASCDVNATKTYDIKNNHGSKLGEIKKGTWLSIKGAGPWFRFEREAYRVLYSEQNNQPRWMWRTVNEPAYVYIGWNRSCD